MKKFLGLFLIFTILLAFTGCRVLDRAEDVIENRVDVIENAAEQVVKDALRPAQKTDPTQLPENGVPTAPSAIISPEDAQIVALEHADVSADEVSRMHTKMDMDDGRQEYDVEFHVEFWEYEYEIDAVTGTILSWDKDN